MQNHYLKRLIAMIMAVVFLITISPAIPSMASPSISRLSWCGDGGELNYAYNNGTYDISYYGLRNGLYWKYIDFTPQDAYGNTVENVDFTVINNNSQIEIVREKNIYLEDQSRLRIIPQPNAPYGTYPITLSFADGFRVQFNIIIHQDFNYGTEGLTAKTIDTVMSNGQVVDLDQANSDLPNAVRFQLKDKNGNILSGQQVLQPDSANYEFASNMNGSHLCYCLATSRPSNASFNFPIFYLTAVPGQPYYSLSLEQITSYNGTRVPSGNYTVGVSLNSGDVAEGSFTIFDYQAIQRIDVELTDAVTGRTINPDQIKPGQQINGKVWYVADNGFKVEAKNISVSFFEKDFVSVHNTSSSTFTFSVDQSAPQEVQLYILDHISGNTFNQIFNVVSTESPEGPNDPGQTDPDNPSIDPGEDPLEQFTVSFDANGHGSDPESMVVEEGASIKLHDLADDGEYSFLGWSEGDNLYKPGENIAVFQSMHLVARWERNPLPASPSTIQMIINSMYMTVDGKYQTLDTAPYIKQDRTYVPIRALSEGFGAKVEWINDDRSVIITLDDKTVTMMIGLPYYWVNEELKMMDVSSEIQAETGRTFIPIRFAAEALGFQVDPQYNHRGETESVLFQYQR